MAISLPDNARGPILALTLPASVSEVTVVVRNNSTAKTLALVIPVGWSFTGASTLQLNWFRRTITANGVDFSLLLSPTDNELWLAPNPLLAGINDVEIEALTPVLSSTKSPGTVANDASFGTKAWNNVNNAKASDNLNASCKLNGATTNYLKATNYGFALPLGAGIVGIQPASERRFWGTFAVKDSRVRIVKGGVIGATELGSGATWPSGETNASDGVQKFGGPTNLCGQVWAPADINSAGFGFALAATEPVGGAEPIEGDSCFVDHMPITVFYRTPATYAAKATLRWEKGYY